jgi:hypothetical protein
MGDIYTARGYKNRTEYLKAQAREYGVEEEVAFVLADALGLNEDFDGFLAALDDAAVLWPEMVEPAEYIPAPRHDETPGNTSTERDDDIER